MKLRLGYLVPEFPSQTHAFFWREIRALRRMGEEVRLVSTRRPSSSSCRHGFAAAAIKETRYLFPAGLSSLVVWAPRHFSKLRLGLTYLGGLTSSGFNNRLRQYVLLTMAIDLVRWAHDCRIDHVHGHSCADTAHILALARRLGGPSYSLTLHGDLAVYGSDHRAKMEKAKFISVVGGHLQCQVIQCTGLAPRQIRVTCMGVETTELEALGRDRSYSPGTLHLVSVARLHPGKGILHALAAVHRGIQKGLDLSYTVAGEGPHRGAIEARIKELDLSSRVTLTGTLSETEVYQLLSKSDALLLPSTGLGEAWPVAVMEAMGAGLPVIASSIGATPEMIASGEDGLLVPQGDEDALLNSIIILANDIDARQRLGEAARKTARLRFDVSITAAALRDAIYNR